jgi:glycosyltransferase involved in cell wall biosynthesis
MVTVLLATYNGAETLPKALNAYCQLQAPSAGWKLVVVDNGSTDGSKELVYSFMDRLPLTYTFESSRGKNAALNTGLAKVEGDLVAFTDDDTLPRPDWLIEMRRAADAHSSFTMFAGTVLPRWEVHPASWILDWVQLGPVFTLTDPSWVEGPIAPDSVYGTNMAIRAQIFAAGHRFDVGIGPRSRSYAMGSETELTLRLAKAGFKSWHCKQAIVEHIIRKFQIDRAWILGRAIRYGRGKYRLGVQYENVNRKKCLGIPGYLIKEVLKKGMALGRARFRGDPAELFEKRWVFNYLLGQAIEARLIHRERHSLVAAQLE